MICDKLLILFYGYSGLAANGATFLLVGPLGRQFTTILMSGSEMEPSSESMQHSMRLTGKGSAGYPHPHWRALIHRALSWDQ